MGDQSGIASSRMSQWNGGENGSAHQAGKTPASLNHFLLCRGWAAVLFLSLFFSPHHRWKPPASCCFFFFFKPPGKRKIISLCLACVCVKMLRSQAASPHAESSGSSMPSWLFLQPKKNPIQITPGVMLMWWLTADGGMDGLFLFVS